MENLINCPVCNSEKIENQIQLQDYFLTQENYKIDVCLDCKIVFTNPRPHSKDIGGYYKSENYISHSNNKKGLINGIYQFVRSYTLKKKFDLIKTYKRGDSILDIGCATGEFLNFFQLNKWKVSGIEPDADARKFAIENYKLIVNEESAIKEIESESKDVITMWHVLEHVYDLNERLTQICRILKHDGYCFIAVPNYKSFDAEYYGKYWAAYDVPRHVYHFDQNSLSAVLQKNNLEIVNTVPMKFDSYYVSLLSEKYMRRKSNIFKAFLIGLRSNLKAMNTGEYSSLIYVVKKII